MRICVLDQFLHGGHHDATRPWIFDAVHGSRYHGIHIRLLEAEVRIDDFAFLKLQVVAVAQRLRTDDTAVFKRKMIGIPAEKLPFQHTVSHSDVTGMPECIATCDVAVFKRTVMKVLQRISARKSDIGKVQISRMKHEVITAHRAVSHANISGKPSALIGDDIAFHDRDLMALPQRLDPVKS